MKTTANYGLKKPDGNDVVNINDLNYNTDILDVKLKEVESKASNIKVPVTSVNGKTGAIVLNSNDIKTNDGNTVQVKVDDLYSQTNGMGQYFNNIISQIRYGMGNMDNKIQDVDKRTTTAQNTANSAVTKADNAQSTANTAKQRADEAFQYANNGKTLISNVVGSPLLASDTFQQQKDKIQNLKSFFMAYLMNKGQNCTGNETLSDLIEKVDNIKIQTEPRVIDIPTCNINTILVDNQYIYCTQSYRGSSNSYVTTLQKYDNNGKLVASNEFKENDSFSYIAKTNSYFYIFVNHSYRHDGDDCCDLTIKIYDLNLTSCIKKMTFKNAAIAYVTTDGDNMWFATYDSINRMIGTSIINSVNSQKGWSSKNIGVCNKNRIVTSQGLYDLTSLKKIEDYYNRYTIFAPKNFSSKNRIFYSGDIYELQGDTLVNTNIKIPYDDGFTNINIIDNLCFVDFPNSVNNNYDGHMRVYDLETGKVVKILPRSIVFFNDGRGIAITTSKFSNSYLEIII